MGFYLNKASKNEIKFKTVKCCANQGNYAPLAKGPLPPPPLMRNIALNSFKAQSAPHLAMLCGVWAGAFWFFHERPKKKVYDYFRDLAPEAQFHQMKEYGVFHSVKASWQEDDAEE